MIEPVYPILCCCSPKGENGSCLSPTLREKQQYATPTIPRAKRQEQKNKEQKNKQGKCQRISLVIYPKEGAFWLLPQQLNRLQLLQPGGNLAA